MLKFVIAIILCSLAMRVKGGGHYALRHYLEEKVGVFREKGSIIEPEELDIKQAIVVRALDGKVLSSLIFAIASKNPLGFIGWLAGVAPSIGEEIGAIGGYRGHWNYTDRDSWFLSKFIPFKSMRLWGATSGALRGAFLGLCLAIVTLNPYMILAGATFPIAYYIGVSIQQFREKLISVDWHLGEWIYGAILGGFLWLV